MPLGIPFLIRKAAVKTTKTTMITAFRRVPTLPVHLPYLRLMTDRRMVPREDQAHDDRLPSVEGVLRNEEDVDDADRHGGQRAAQPDGIRDPVHHGRQFAIEACLVATRHEDRGRPRRGRRRSPQR